MLINKIAFINLVLSLLIILSCRKNNISVDRIYNKNKKICIENIYKNDTLYQTITVNDTIKTHCLKYKNRIIEKYYTVGGYKYGEHIYRDQKGKLKKICTFVWGYLYMEQDFYWNDTIRNFLDSVVLYDYLKKEIKIYDGNNFKRTNYAFIVNYDFFVVGKKNPFKFQIETTKEYKFLEIYEEVKNNPKSRIHKAADVTYFLISDTLIPNQLLDIKGNVIMCDSPSIDSTCVKFPFYKVAYVITPDYLEF